MQPQAQEGFFFIHKALCLLGSAGARRDAAPRQTIYLRMNFTVFPGARENVHARGKGIGADIGVALNCIVADDSAERIGNDCVGFAVGGVDNEVAAKGE